MNKMKKWYFQSLVDDFYKWNNSLLMAVIIFLSSILFDNWYYISWIIFIIIWINFAEKYFKKGREIYLILLINKNENK